jgi:hypothetical protein
MGSEAAEARRGRAKDRAKTRWWGASERDQEQLKASAGTHVGKSLAHD